MLNELFSWWLRQMLGLVPARWQQRDAGPAQAIVVAWDDADGTAELIARRDHKEASLGRFAVDEPGLRLARATLGNRRAPTTILRLPPGFLLERQVTLPLAAEQGLDRVVRYEMDRFTPFAAEEVFWSCSVQRRDRAQGKLALAIALVPRVRLLPAIEALAELQLVPSLLEAAAFGGGMRQIPLGEPDLRRERFRQRALVAAAAGCAALAVAVIGLPFLQQSWASDAIEERIAAIKPRVAEAEALRQRLAATAAGSDAVTAEHARVGDALQAIAALTDILGDDTTLVGLTLQRRQVTLEGQSAAAAKLITTLSADPTIRNASFAAPVMRSETGADMFSIKAEVAP
jgi:general secretion pathway protein L